jgi:hypothetical protein
MVPPRTRRWRRERFLEGVVALPLVPTCLPWRCLRDSLGGVLDRSIGTLVGRSGPGAGLLPALAAIVVVGVLTATTVGGTGVSIADRLPLGTPS